MCREVSRVTEGVCGCVEVSGFAWRSLEYLKVSVGVWRCLGVPVGL